MTNLDELKQEVEEFPEESIEARSIEVTLKQTGKKTSSWKPAYQGPIWLNIEQKHIEPSPEISSEDFNKIIEILTLGFPRIKKINLSKLVKEVIKFHVTNPNTDSGIYGHNQQEKSALSKAKNYLETHYPTKENLLTI